MNYISVCSGIEAASVAWKELGWNPLAFSETNKFCRSLLKHYHPNVPLYGDFTKIDAEDFKHQSVDLIVGGTPCQSFSLSGLGGGLDDERGNLAIEFFRLVDRIKPTWFIWENVPGVLRNDKGNTFKTILSTVDELGYGYAWRILDAQYFGVPQKRRRLFLIGHNRGWQYPFAALHDSKCMFTNDPEIRNWEQENSKSYIRDFTDNCRILTFNRRYLMVNGALSGPLSTRPHHDRNLIVGYDKNNKPFIRRMTALEAERFQGFPDNYTLIPHNGKMLTDNCRYKMLGNSMAVPVMKWIGNRIDFLENLNV